MLGLSSPLRLALRNLLLRSSDNIFHAEAELLQQLLKGCRGSKRFNTNVAPLATGVFAPAKIGCLFHRHSGLHVSRQNRLSVASVLVVEQFPRRHTNDTRPHALLAQLLIGLQAECNLAARADE